MKGLACQYAIIRFLPYAETGEFANVGVVLACPATGFLDARLLPTKNTRRITDFFDQLDKGIYRDALRYLNDELKRIREFVADGAGAGGANFVQNVFGGLTKPREALLRYGDTRVVLADDPQVTLEKLFARFVERDFADKAYHEKLQLTRNVRDALMRAEVGQHYKLQTIGNDFVHAQVPFVHMRDDRPVAAIKPLYLGKEDPNQVLEVGGHWLERVRRLARHNVLPNMMIAVRRPDDHAERAGQAADEIIEDFRKQGVVVATAADTKAIKDFARAALH